MQKLKLISIVEIPFDHASLQQGCDGVASKWNRPHSTTNESRYVKVKSSFWSYQSENMLHKLPRRQRGGDEAIMKPVLLSQKAMAGRDLGVKQSAKQVKWHLQESLPTTIMEKLGTRYGISYEVSIHPQDPRVGAIKLIPRGNCPHEYKIGISLFKEAVARRYQLKSASTASCV